MSFASHIRNQLHVDKEVAEAAEPYDAAVASRVIVRPKPTPSDRQTSVCWDSNPWDVFDRKTVLAFTGNQDRLARLQTEFDRVGLTDVNVHWNFDNKWIKDAAFERIGMFQMREKVFFNNAFGHYSIIKTSYELGCNSCLVMEDDIRFLRDVEQIRRSLIALPGDFDIALLDSLHHLETDHKPGCGVGDPVNDFWVSMRHDESATSAACYAMSRRGMLSFIELYERDSIYPSDCYFNWDRLMSVSDNAKIKKLYIASPKVARQVQIENSKTNTSYTTWSQSGYRTAPRKNYGK